MDYNQALEAMQEIGITTETVSFFTGIPVVMTDKAQIGETFGYEGKTMHYIMFMCMQALYSKPADKYESYVVSIIKVMKERFYVTYQVVSNYIGVSSAEFSQFLEQPQELPFETWLKICVTTLYFYISMIQNPYLYMG